MPHWQGLVRAHIVATFHNGREKVHFVLSRGTQRLYRALYGFQCAFVDLASSLEQLCVAIKNECYWGIWVAQSVNRLTSAQVTISEFVGSSPTLGSVLTARNLEPASISVSSSLSAPSLLALSLSLSLSLKSK